MSRKIQKYFLLFANFSYFAVQLFLFLLEETWIKPFKRQSQVVVIFMHSKKEFLSGASQHLNKDVFCRQMKVWNPQELSQKLALFSKIDFVDGLRTVAGAGSPRTRHGLAIHIFACNSRWCLEDEVVGLIILHNVQLCIIFLFSMTNRSMCNSAYQWLHLLGR